MIAIWQNGKTALLYLCNIVQNKNTMITSETRIIDLSVSQFRQLIREENSITNPPEVIPVKPKILRRKDVAELFSISLVTLTQWVKTGKLKQHSIASRRYFIESEVYEVLQSSLNKKK
jgi:hypothetical protein